MPNTYFSTEGTLAARIMDTSTTALFALGATTSGNNGTEWVYVQASSAITANFVVVIDEAFAAAHLSTANDARGDLVGVAPVAFASGEFGWVCRKGVINAQVLASCAANVRLNTTATAGALDDDGTAGAMAIEGFVLTTARAASAGTAPALLNYPTVGVTI